MKPIATLCALAVLLAACANPIPSDAPPGTDIFLITMDGSTPPINLTDRPGYDNQPAFSPNSKTIYYTSQRGEQTDIYALPIDDLGADSAAGASSAQQITTTVESEYSPTMVPGLDAISVVRVEQDGKQLLWRLPLDGGQPKLLLPDIEPVGYHAWADETKLGLFVLGEPMTLQSAPVGPGIGRVLAENIGRGVQRMPDGRLAYVQIHDETRSSINAVNLVTGEIETLIDSRPGSQDFAIAQDGTIWMAQQNRVFSWRPGPSGSVRSGWQQRLQYDQPGLQNITRIALSADGQHIALAADR